MSGPACRVTLNIAEQHVMTSERELCSLGSVLTGASSSSQPPSATTTSAAFRRRQSAWVTSSSATAALSCPTTAAHGPATRDHIPAECRSTELSSSASGTRTRQDILLQNMRELQTDVQTSLSRGVQAPSLKT